MARRPKPSQLEPLLERTMAVADPSRWQIVRLLGESPRTVTQLARATGLSVAATCRHVQRLRVVGVVEARRRGKELQCRPAAPDTPVGRWLRGLLGGSGPAGGAPEAAARRPAAESAGATRVRVTRTPSRRPGGAESSPAAPPEAPRRFRELEDYLL